MKLEKNTGGGAPRFPLANYRLRCTGQPDTSESKNKNVMLVFTFECVGYVDGNGTVQPTMTIDGVETEVAGWEFQFWATFFPNKDTGELQNIGLAQLHAAWNLPLEFDADPLTSIPIVDGQPVNYSGRELYARCQSRENNPVGPDGKPLINLVTGKPVTQSQRRIVEIYY